MPGTSFTLILLEAMDFTDKIQPLIINTHILHKQWILSQQSCNLADQLKLQLGFNFYLSPGRGHL